MLSNFPLPASSRSFSAMNSSSPNAAASDPFATLPKIPALDNTFGALLIGCFVGFIQYGWTANQCYTYFRMYPGDRLILKGLVATVLVLETFHTVLCMHIIYYYLTTNYFNPIALQEGVWSNKLLGVITGAVILASQSFFLRRVWKIGRQFRPLVAVAAILLLGEFGFATAVTVDTFIHPTLHNSSQAWMNSAGVGMAVLADTLLTAALIFSLHSSRTGVRRTDSIIDLLIMYAINTGLVTGIMNLLSLIFALAMPNNLIYAGIVIVATKLYANSMMAVLNSRRALAAQGTVVHTASYDISAMQRQWRAAGSRLERWTGPTFSHTPSSPTAIDIKVTQETLRSDPMGSLDGFDAEHKVNAGEAV
ncbi:uncharacterized protein TRAVEDRAFT_75155 [Trametes versicolor FP-101664 SS1]|uniref:uncharacterized protein n=1 Tax=Trametes versicolor (strain FP-101664) TaxID=717944 RepID=UPI0004621AA8|nr:uncharacterized protein TRAVEDRAFT_75155 [Trametes versicolor FP-101664 SS1]EIW52927.1 hypothetical protein TRAVEDRAFT_75155 [Trametes versicolor FP-101664 SS1]